MPGVECASNDTPLAAASSPEGNDRVGAGNQARSRPTGGGSSRSSAPVSIGSCADLASPRLHRQFPIVKRPPKRPDRSPSPRNPIPVAWREPRPCGRCDEGLGIVNDAATGLAQARWPQLARICMPQALKLPPRLLLAVMIAAAGLACGPPRRKRKIGKSNRGECHRFLLRSAIVLTTGRPASSLKT
jgi:hypothetical protein